MNDATRIICILLKERRLKIEGIYASSLAQNEAFPNEVLPLQRIHGYQGKVIIASFVRVKEKIKLLRELGVENNNILRLF